jgi:hypothetical protein
MPKNCELKLLQSGITVAPMRIAAPPPGRFWQLSLQTL